MVVIEANIPANREYATNVISISTSVNGIIYINFEFTDYIDINDAKKFNDFIEKKLTIWKGLR